LKITIDTESIWDADNKAIHKKEVWYKEFYTPRGYRTAYLRYIHGMSQNTVDDVAETPAVELKEPEEKKPDDAKVTEKNPKKCTCGYLAIEIDGVLVPVHETNPEVRKRLFPNHPLERGKTGPCPIHDNPENQAKWMKYYGVKNKEVLQKIVDKEVEKEKEEKK
jgi:hypothetical protein